jgi:hypothetical protein
MAGSSFDFLTLPPDAGNTGKKMLVRKVDIGGGEFRYANVFTEGRSERVLGVYRTVLPQVTIQAAAQNGTTTGFAWGVIPSGSTVKARIRQVSVITQHSTVLATPTAPRLILQVFSYTGTPSGATLTPGRVDSAGPAPVLDMRAAMTGMTVNLAAAAPLGVAGVVGALTAVAAYCPCETKMIEADEDGFPVIAAGQGFVIYQDVAGTTSDTRKASISIVHDECDFS